MDGNIFRIKLKIHVMVNFMCQLNWPQGYPDSWSKVISECICEGVSGREFDL